MDSTRSIPGRFSRREVLRLLFAGGAGSVLAACGPNQSQPPASPDVPKSSVPPAPEEEASPSETALKPSPTNTVSEKDPVETSAKTATAPAAAGEPYLAIAHGSDPAAITEAAVKALGGIERFVSAGYEVIIKPNICTDYYSFEYAATTNPVVVATLVRLALGAGAKRVRVMDLPFGGTCESAYSSSGIGDAVKEAGGEMEIMNRNKFRVTPIPDGKSITEWKIYHDVLACDLLIDVPIVKHHNLARLTAGQKNLMGVIQNRGGIHSQMGQRLADLLSLIRPGLTVVDAVRTLMDHGPTGGNLDDVRMTNMVFASRDTVAADAYAATLLNLKAMDIPYIQAAAEMGLGTMDLASVKVEEFNV